MNNNTKIWQKYLKNMDLIYNINQMNFIFTLKVNLLKELMCTMILMKKLDNGF